MNRITPTLLLLVTIVVAGCSDGRLKLGKVEGTVNVNGQPLQAGKIMFQSDTARGAIGKIVEGKIVEVTTYESGDGVPVGVQRIAIQPSVDDSIMMKNPAEAAKLLKEIGIPMKFQQAKTSGLSHEIKRRGSNVITINIEK